MKDLDRLFDLARNQKTKASFDQLSKRIDSSQSKPKKKICYLKGSIMTGLIFISLLTYFSFPERDLENPFSMQSKENVLLHQLEHGKLELPKGIPFDTEIQHLQSTKTSSTSDELPTPNKKAPLVPTPRVSAPKIGKQHFPIFTSSEKKDSTKVVYAVHADEGMVGWVKLMKNLEKEGFVLSVQHAEFDDTKKKIQCIKLKLKTPWGHKCKIVYPPRPKLFQSKDKMNCGLFEYIEFGWHKKDAQVHGFYHQVNGGWKSHLSGKEQ